MAQPQNHGTTEPRYSYRNLELWKRAQDLAQEIVVVVQKLPANRSNDILVRQIIRAVTSIPANIAEGHGRYTWAAYRNHLSIAKWSTCELDSWLDLLVRLSLISREQEQELHARCSSLIAALTGRMRDLEKINPKMVKEETVAYTVDNDLDDALEESGSAVPRLRGSAS